MSRQLLADLAAQVLIDLDDLELGFGDLALGLGDRRDERAALAAQPRIVAFERRQATDRHQVLLPQVAHALELPLDQLDLVLLGGDLLVDRPLLLLELADALLQLGLLAGAGVAAELEQSLLPGHDARRQSDRTTGRAVPRGRLISAVPSQLGLEPGLPRPQLIEVFWPPSAALARVIVSSRRTTTSPALHLVAVADMKSRRRCRRSGAGPS